LESELKRSKSIDTFGIVFSFECFADTGGSLRGFINFSLWDKISIFYRYADALV